MRNSVLWFLSDQLWCGLWALNDQIICVCQELISQVNHYNAKMRRDSLVGMMELFEAHPEVLPKHVGSVIEAVGERTSDVDAGVRSTLFKLLSDGVLPKMGSGNMKPFMPLMMAHVCR